MATPSFYSGTGRRKTAIARVRLLPGEGEIVVNGRSLEEHFGNAVNESDVRMPFRVTGTEGHYNAIDRKSTRLNSSHTVISYAVFCLKKKKKKIETTQQT